MSQFQGQSTSSSINVHHQAAKRSDCDGCAPDLTESFAIAAQRYQSNFVEQDAARYLIDKNKYCEERVRLGICQQANRHAERMALLGSRVKELLE